MGMYLNIDNKMFKEMRNSKIYVDKSLMIDKLNRLIGTDDQCICVSRPRRFGKSVDANMLVAYYSKGSNSHELFDDLNIAKCESYKKYLNQRNVIHLNMQDFLSMSKNINEMISLICSELI